MADEPSGVVAQVILMSGVVILWGAVLWGAWSVIHGWRP